MHYYQFNIGDFRSGTINMTRQARWIYRDMLDVYYDTENPLSKDLDRLCDEIGVSEDAERAVVQRILRFKFTETDAGYVHAVCESEIALYHAKAEIAKANGKLGGRPRIARANPKEPSGFQVGTDPDGFGNQVATGSEANEEPTTNNQKPTNTSEAKASGGEPPDKQAPEPMDDKDKIFTYGVPMLVNAGSTDKASRSFLAGLAKGHGDPAVVQALRDCIRAKAIDPLTWLAAALPPGGGKKTAGKHAGFDQLDYREGVNDDGTIA